ncbi:MAG: hypothetical protein ACT4N9_12425 [Paracoccaceae bacterium]
MRVWGVSGMVVAILAGVTLGGAARAEVPVEVSTIDGTQVTIHLHDFLSAQELGVLRLVGGNSQMLQAFMQGATGYGAMALSPDDGYIRGGLPSGSASARMGLADAQAAAAAALEACNAARTGAAECVVVLELGPAG